MPPRVQLSGYKLVKPQDICPKNRWAEPIAAASTGNQVSYMFVRPARISSLNIGLIESSVRASKAAYSPLRSISFAVGDP